VADPIADPVDANPRAAKVVRTDEPPRYELLVDGERRGHADIRVERDGRVAFTHTEVDRALRGKGYSPVLVGRALDDVRARGERAIARCSYVHEFVDSHPEYADLFAP
jgi:predicted GNAT family acetyltransferase